MQSHGCTLDFSESGRRRVQGKYLGTWLDSEVDGCTWDELDDLARDVDMICCEDGGNCPASDTAIIPSSCSPACAVSMHEFITACGTTLENTLAGDVSSFFMSQGACLYSFCRSQARSGAVATADPIPGNNGFRAVLSRFGGSTFFPQCNQKRGVPTNRRRALGQRALTSKLSRAGCMIVRRTGVRENHIFMYERPFAQPPGSFVFSPFVA
jgi:hypothetical protein